MQLKNNTCRIALIGGGPAALYLYKQLVESEFNGWEVHIYERKNLLGAGMPYSNEGSNDEHITNISDNEVPELVNTVESWITAAPPPLKQHFHINAKNFNEYKVLPRLLFGSYLEDQFRLLLQKAQKKKIETVLHLNTTVEDLSFDPVKQSITVVNGNTRKNFDVAVICTGHQWPLKNEESFPHYFDSPYPPRKLQMKWSQPIALRGSSLTAFDAVRTLSRMNGCYQEDGEGNLQFQLAPGSQGFKLVLHSLDGLLPAIRVHFEDTALTKKAMLSEEEIARHREANEGFVSLDFLFEKNFKEPFREKDPAFYNDIKDLGLEEFVNKMMDLRERLDPFTLFKAEYAEAEKSIRRKESVHWKEMLANLSFAMNYPAKHFSAEDMLRLKKVLMPLISVIIAFTPQSSARELLALHEAGVLDLVAVDHDSKVIPQKKGGIVYVYTDESGVKHADQYPMFVDCLGQPQFDFGDFPFKSLIKEQQVSPARLRFRSKQAALDRLQLDGRDIEEDASGTFYLRVPGININDYFQVLDQYGAANEQLYIMAVPHIGGLNPDYSGLDFCETASERIIKALESAIERATHRATQNDDSDSQPSSGAHLSTESSLK